MEKRTAIILFGVTCLAVGATGAVIYYDRKAAKKEAEDNKKFAELERKYQYLLYTNNNKVEVLQKQTTNGFGFLNSKIVTLQSQTTLGINNCNTKIDALKKQHDSDFATVQNELYEAKTYMEQEPYEPVKLPPIGFRKGKV